MVDERPTEPPRTPEEFRAALAGTQYEELFRDEAKLDALMFDLMKQSRDPMAREVGAGLADGTLTRRQLADSSVYADFLTSAFAAGRGLDPQSAFDEAMLERDQTRSGGDTERPGSAGGRRASPPGDDRPAR